MRPQRPTVTTISAPQSLEATPHPRMPAASTHSDLNPHTQCTQPAPAAEAGSTPSLPRPAQLTSAIALLAPGLFCPHSCCGPFRVPGSPHHSLSPHSLLASHCPCGTGQAPLHPGLATALAPLPGPAPEPHPLSHVLLALRHSSQLSSAGELLLTPQSPTPNLLLVHVSQTTPRREGYLGAQPPPAPRRGCPRPV